MGLHRRIINQPLGAHEKESKMINVETIKNGWIIRSDVGTYRGDGSGQVFCATKEEVAETLLAQLKSSSELAIEAEEQRREYMEQKEAAMATPIGLVAGRY